MTPENLYVHFPFCRRKCSYCALYSRAGVGESDRAAYVSALAEDLKRRLRPSTFNLQPSTFSTIYFGGGSPALCGLAPLFKVLASRGASRARRREGTADNFGSDGLGAFEFTVEMHPLDVTAEKLEELKAGGVNRISMGVQSFDDATLARMGRGYTIAEAFEAFRLVKRYFDNVGIDLIVGYPGEKRLEIRDKRLDADDWLEKFVGEGMRHCSVYSLQNERGLKDVPEDDVILDEIKRIARELDALGLKRYEISNYAVPGYECRHNLAVWRGEDYLGLGEGACGREGLKRTRGIRARRTPSSSAVGRPEGDVELEYSVEEVSPEFDRKERALFRLRTREGLDAAAFPEWRETLARFVKEGVIASRVARRTMGEESSRVARRTMGEATDIVPRVTHERVCSQVYVLTERGTEVCDAILAELV